MALNTAHVLTEPTDTLGSPSLSVLSGSGRDSKSHSEGNSDREERAAAELRSAWRVAGLLLLIMSALFALSLQNQSENWAGWLRAFTEAAMVGAIADWFAVTALFRHPLGIPFPHSAIIPRNQERIATTLGEFVQSNFLNPEVLSARLQAASPGKTVANWLSEEKNSRWLADRGAALLPKLMDALGEEEVRKFLGAQYQSWLKEAPLPVIIGKAADLVLEADTEGKLLAEMLRGTSRFLDTNGRSLSHRLEKCLPWYVPGFLHQRVFTSMANNLRKLLGEIEADPSHELRPGLRAGLRRACAELVSSPEMARGSEELKAWLLTSREFQEFTRKLAAQLKERINTDLDGPDSSLRVAFSKALRLMGQNLKEDAALQEMVSVWIREACGSVAGTYGIEIQKLIADTVRGWDSKTVVRKTELTLGRDLQYIRINGTLVGGAVGVTIKAIELALGGVG